MTAYTPAQLAACLGRMSENRNVHPLLRNLARCAEAGIPRYVIEPADLEDDTVMKALLVAAAPAPDDVDISRLDDLLSTYLEGQNP